MFSEKKQRLFNADSIAVTLADDRRISKQRYQQKCNEHTRAVRCDIADRGRTRGQKILNDLNGERKQKKKHESRIRIQLRVGPLKKQEKKSKGCGVVEQVAE
jgi:hypothetical protein